MSAANREKIFRVVRNLQGHYSLWPAEAENPLGWRDAGRSGLEADCLAYIDEVWTQMSPSKGAAIAK
jgi:MbtH protein